LLKTGLLSHKDTPFTINPLPFPDNSKLNHYELIIQQQEPAGAGCNTSFKEATRDGAPPIDLIDGDLLCEKLKEFRLGVKTEQIEEVTIQPEWFEKI
jgi:hypothetical protein